MVSWSKTFNADGSMLVKPLQNHWSQWCPGETIPFHRFEKNDHRSALVWKLGTSNIKIHSYQIHIALLSPGAAFGKVNPQEIDLHPPPQHDQYQVHRVLIGYGRRCGEKRGNWSSLKIRNGHWVTTVASKSHYPSNVLYRHQRTMRHHHHWVA